MTPQYLTATKFSHHYKLALKDNKKAELIGNLKGSGVNMYVMKGNMVGELQDIHRGKLISVTKTISKERLKGCMVK